MKSYKERSKWNYAKLHEHFYGENAEWNQYREERINLHRKIITDRMVNYINEQVNKIKGGF
ncbi:hypothetical protein BTO30_07075 [Domibacillus antri]|uniref:Uncharacterized protein n=1 Tax=Domibacillus antri TaxID=1714264 RepID=A0A1Q8Q6E1_9BACI|nr:hypothetical protein [Domibacillus antri]OLN22899.1 hypothetical protein BTO30_07075 [Domibacillus antri]